MTFFETSGQALTFLMLVYAGAAAGVLYDVLGIARHFAGRALTMLIDVVFYVLVAVLCAFALMRGGENAVRWYAILGLLCGLSVYALGIRRVFTYLAKRVRQEKAKHTANKSSSPGKERKTHAKKA